MNIENIKTILCAQTHTYLIRILEICQLDEWCEHNRPALFTDDYYWELKAIVQLSKYKILNTKIINKKRFIKINSAELEKTCKLI